MDRLVIVTGMSGSGKSVAAKTLEDMGYLCVDNLPAVMLPEFVDLLGGRNQHAAVVIDVRQPGFLGSLKEILARIRQDTASLKVLFLEASDTMLLRRFSESRRPHPLARQGRIAEGIAEERILLRDLKEVAEEVVDTSAMSVHDIRRHVQSMFAGHGEAEKLQVAVVSFGFKHGLPPEANMVHDVRFLPNPYWDQRLRHLSGLDSPVRKAVLDTEACREFLHRTKQSLAFLLPHYEQEGRTYLTLAVGCTGGRHRSVALATELASVLDELGYPSQLLHRDLNRLD